MSYVHDLGTLSKYKPMYPLYVLQALKALLAFLETLNPKLQPTIVSCEFMGLWLHGPPAFGFTVAVESARVVEASTRRTPILTFG